MSKLAQTFVYHQIGPSTLRWLYCISSKVIKSSKQFYIFKSDMSNKSPDCHLTLLDPPTHGSDTFIRSMVVILCNYITNLFVLESPYFLEWDTYFGTWNHSNKSKWKVSTGIIITALIM